MTDSSQSHMNHLPTDILLHLLEAFSYDQEAVQLLSTGRSLFQRGRSTYKLKTRFKLKLITTTSDSTDEFIAPLSTAEIILPYNRPWVTHPANTSTSDSSMLIGRIHRLHINVMQLKDARGSEIDQTIMKCFEPTKCSIQVHPGLIPLSVRSIEWVDGWPFLLFTTSMVELLHLEELSFVYSPRTPDGFRANYLPPYFNQLKYLKNLVLDEWTYAHDFSQLLALKELRIKCSSFCSGGLQTLKLPESLEKLDLHLWGKTFSGLMLPSGLRSLTLTCSEGVTGEYQLPESLTYFNAFKMDAIDPKILPSQLKHFIAPPRLLVTGSKDSIPLSQVQLPKCLVELDLRAYLTDDIASPHELILPRNLQILHVNFKDASFYELVLPTSLTQLTYEGGFLLTKKCKKHVFQFTPRIQRLDLSLTHNPQIQRLTHWPTDLRVLLIGDFNYPIESVVFPACLEELVIDSHRWDGSLPKADLPAGLVKLHLTRFLQTGVLNQLHHRRLPHLTSLTLGNATKDASLPTVLPKRLLTLHLTSHSLMNPSLDQSLPPGLTSLDLGFGFNRRLVGRVFPDSLTSLRLGNDFGLNGINVALDEFILPQSLHVFDLSHTHFDHEITSLALPPNFRYLSLSSAFTSNIVELSRRPRTILHTSEARFSACSDHFRTEAIELETNKTPLYQYEYVHGSRNSKLELFFLTDRSTSSQHVPATTIPQSSDLYTITYYDQ